MAKKFHSSQGSYVGPDARRKQEAQDAGMISEDHNAIANLPQGVIMHEWPKTPYGNQSELDDTIKGIQRQQKDDTKKQKSSEYPEKY